VIDGGSLPKSIVYYVVTLFGAKKDVIFYGAEEEKNPTERSWVA
jgi:hypothetical protein